MEARKQNKLAQKKSRYDAWFAKQSEERQSKIAQFKKQGKKGGRSVRKMHRIDKTKEAFKADNAADYEKMKAKKDNRNAQGRSNNSRNRNDRSNNGG